jgi:pyroglutamyl-peptidase
VILLAGFEPFARHARNPSGEIAARLDGATIGGARIASIVLPVARRSAWSTLVAEIDRRRPRAVVALGLAGRRRSIDVERRSRNRDDFRSADALGERPRGEAIEPGGPPLRETRLPVAEIVAAVAESGLPARASRDAGRFVCNHVYHRLLVRAEGGALEALFVHLPPLAEETHGGLPLEDAERAVRLVLGCVAGYLGDPGASDRA